MLVKLIEVTRDIGGVDRLSEVFVNPAHIISVNEDTSNHPLLKENLGLSEDVRFSLLFLSEGTGSRRMKVIGTPTEISNKVKKRQVLRG